MHLLARASANDRQMVGFARFGLAERALEFAEIACSLRVDRDDELVGSPIPLCFITIAPSTAAGGKKSPPTVSALPAPLGRPLANPAARSLPQDYRGALDKSLFRRVSNGRSELKSRVPYVFGI